MPDHNSKLFRNHSLTEKPFPNCLFFIIYTLESDKDFILHYTHLKLDSEHNKVSKHILKLVYKSNPNNSNKFCWYLALYHSNTRRRLTPLNTSPNTQACSLAITGSLKGIFLKGAGFPHFASKIFLLHWCLWELLRRLNRFLHTFMECLFFFYFKNTILSKLKKLIQVISKWAHFWRNSI